MKINKNSNLYTVVYIVVLVLVVGVGLSLVYQALRPQQTENIANDKKRQILEAALIVPQAGESVADLYQKYIVSTRVVNSRGLDVAGAPAAFDINPAMEMKKPDDRRMLPVFVCQKDNETKYIVPVYGMGLWGPIWGYIAMNSDGTSIYGAYFTHQGETPGLGAEIAKPAFSNQFKGQTLYEDGNFQPINVVKSGHEPASGSYVHAISGGTITSQGVQTMLEKSMRPYNAFFKNLQNQGK